jgi:hypothetical protein
MATSGDGGRLFAIEDGWWPRSANGDRSGGDGEPAASAGTDRYLWEWQLRRSCREGDPAVFFHPDGERGLPGRRER